jgi:hypothetical protein
MTDSGVRTTRRVQAAVVTAGVAGALGVAGAVGVASAQASGTDGSHQNRSAGQRYGERDDDGEQSREGQPRIFQAPQQGNLQAPPAGSQQHATTSGS